MHVEPYTAIRTNCQPKSYTYTVKFDRDITAPEYWQEELDTLRMGKEGDDYILVVNTSGGDLRTLAELLHIIKHSPAHFHCVLSGTALSAGGPIMLACDTVEVGDYAEMLVHTAQGSGYYTSAQGLEQFSAMSNRTAHKLLTNCYEGFLTPDEINQALDGKEFWFDSDEIKRRLIQRDEYFAALDEDDGTGFTKEQMSVMSKDEILAVIFGEDDSDVVPALGDSVPESSKVWDELIKLSATLSGIDGDGAIFNDYMVFSDGQVTDSEGKFVSLKDVHISQLRECATNFSIPYKPSHSAAFLRKQVQGFVDKVVTILNQK